MRYHCQARALIRVRRKAGSCSNAGGTQHSATQRSIGQWIQRHVVKVLLTFFDLYRHDEESALLSFRSF